MDSGACRLVTGDSASARRPQHPQLSCKPQPPALQDYAKAGASMFTFHIEAVVPDVAQLSTSEPHPAVVEVAQAVRAAGMKVGAVAVGAGVGVVSKALGLRPGSHRLVYANDRACAGGPGAQARHAR
jgi:hypothetical protein